MPLSRRSSGRIFEGSAHSLLGARIGLGWPAEPFSPLGRSCRSMAGLSRFRCCSMTARPSGTTRPSDASGRLGRSCCRPEMPGWEEGRCSICHGRSNFCIRRHGGLGLPRGQSGHSYFGGAGAFGLARRTLTATFTSKRVGEKPVPSHDRRLFGALLWAVHLPPAKPNR